MKVEASAVIGVLKVSGTCPITKKPWELMVPEAGFAKWRKGTLIQDAFPLMSSDDRELLISGTSPEGWQKLFGQ